MGNLSGGNQQKVALARWLAAGPARADPRRADAGRGRRRQGRDPPADERAGRRGPGDPDDLVRAARDPRHERPDRRDARRDDRRGHWTAQAPPRRRSSSWRWGTASRRRERKIDRTKTDHEYTDTRKAGGSLAELSRRSGPDDLSYVYPWIRCSHDLGIGASCRWQRRSWCCCWSWPRSRPVLPRRPAPAAGGGNAPVLVAAVGMTLVILCRQIDISIGSIFSICGVVAGLLARLGPADGAGRPGDARWPGAAWGRSTGRWSPAWDCRRSW